MIFEESYTLHNGVAIPKLALGTWFIDDDKAAEAVQAAVPWHPWIRELRVMIPPPRRHPQIRLPHGRPQKRLFP